jgi:hypothetical protein
MGHEEFNPKPGDLRLTLEHAGRGYANAQDVIKFVDTKTGVITGLATLTTAAPIALFRWSAGLEGSLPANLTNFQLHHPICFIFICYGFLGGMALGALSIVMAMHGLMARNPRRPYQGLLELIQKAWLWLRRKPRSRPSSAIAVIFPIYRRHDTENARRYFKKVTVGMTMEEILHEHEFQLFEVGRILNQKITWNRRAVSALQLQIFAYFAVGAVTMILLQSGL